MKNLHFIGIGGAGMAPLAELALSSGMAVSGSDMERSAKTDKLIAAGAKVFIGHDAANLPQECDLVVYSSAVTPENPELSGARKCGIRTVRRGEFLGEFARKYRRVVAISGTHGKSSITAMLTHILEVCGCNPGFLIGAERPDGEPGGIGKGNDLFITEVDESDGTHTCIQPFLGIVPNVESDHSWSVGGEGQLKENFRTFGRNCQNLLIADKMNLRELFGEHPRLTAEVLPEKLENLCGYFAQNGALALRAAIMLGVPESEARAALLSYRGIARRMQICAQTEKLTILEDYAHHPTEIAEAIKFVRLQYPGKVLHAVIQPHRYARLEKFFPEFVSTLNQADKVTVVPVFAAWTESGKVGGLDLADALKRGQYFEGEWEDLAAILEQEKGVVLLLGAGTIGKLAALLKKNPSFRGEKIAESGKNIG